MSEPLLPPIGMLAELTHRCPLQCPYCSNPTELLKANRELDTADLARPVRAGRRPRRAAGPSFRRRADLAPRPRAIGGRAFGARRLHQSDHRRRRHRRRPHRGARRSRARPSAIELSGRAAGDHRSHRQPSRQPREEAGDGAARARGRPAAHHQRADPPPQHRGSAGVHRTRAFARRRAAGDRQCAVFRLGARQPRCADAGPRGGRAPGGDRRSGARAARRHHEHRLRHAGLFRHLSETLHGRLGARRLHGGARRHGAAVPRRADDPVAALRAFRRPHAGRDLGRFAGLQCVSRHRLDAGAVPQLRTPRDRLGRLPMPGDGDCRRRRRDRPGLREVADPCPHGHADRTGAGNCGFRGSKACRESSSIAG